MAVVYAAAVGLRRRWELLVEGLTVIEAVLRNLGRRGAVPEDLAGRIGACQDDGQLDRWMDATLDEFRSRAGL